jgi:hypothetical protein
VTARARPGPAVPDAARTHCGPGACRKDHAQTVGLVSQRTEIIAAMSEILLKLAPLVAMALQLAAGRFGPSRIRSVVKANAELLEKLPADGEARTMLTKHIEYLTRRLVEIESRRFRRKRDATGVVLALVMVVGFGYWSYVLIESGTWWWAVATGLGALVGLVGLVDEVQGKDEVADSTKAPPASVAEEELVHSR